MLFAGGRPCRVDAFLPPRLLSGIKTGFFPRRDHRQLAAVIAPFILPNPGPPNKLIAIHAAIHMNRLPHWDKSPYAKRSAAFCRTVWLGQMVRLRRAMSYHHFAPEDEKRPRIFCQTYGEAGAIDFFGPKLGAATLHFRATEIFFCGTRPSRIAW